MVIIRYLNAKYEEEEFTSFGGLEIIVSTESSNSTVSSDDYNKYYSQYNITRNDPLSDYEVTSEVPFIGRFGYSEILGMYVSSEDRVYVVSGLDPYLKTYVKHHEWEHRRRAQTGESQDERLVDHAVEQKLGYGINRYG